MTAFSGLQIHLAHLPNVVREQFPEERSFPYAGMTAKKPSSGSKALTDFLVSHPGLDARFDDFGEVQFTVKIPLVLGPHFPLQVHLVHDQYDWDPFAKTSDEVAIHHSSDELRLMGRRDEHDSVQIRAHHMDHALAISRSHPPKRVFPGSHPFDYSIPGTESAHFDPISDRDGGALAKDPDRAVENVHSPITAEEIASSGIEPHFAKFRVDLGYDRIRFRIGKVFGLYRTWFVLFRRTTAHFAPDSGFRYIFLIPVLWAHDAYDSFSRQ